MNFVKVAMRVMLGAPRYVKEGMPKETFREKLEKHPNAFVHFSDVNKVGINPKYAFAETPAGLYGYFMRDVLDLVDSDGYEKTVVNFGSDREWAHIFDINSDNVLDTGRYSQEDYGSDLASLENTFGKDVINKVEHSFDKASGIPKGYIGKLWYMTRVLGTTMIGWNKVLRNLGYDAALDDGNGVISRGQPSCVVVLDTTKVVQLDTVHNDMAYGVDEDEVVNAEFTFIARPDMPNDEMRKAANKVSEVLESVGGVSCLWNGRKLYLGYQVNKKAAVKKKIDSILNGDYGDSPEKFAAALGLKVRVKN